LAGGGVGVLAFFLSFFTLEGEKRPSTPSQKTGRSFLPTVRRESRMGSHLNPRGPPRGFLFYRAMAPPRAPSSGSLWPSPLGLGLPRQTALWGPKGAVRGGLGSGRGRPEVWVVNRVYRLPIWPPQRLTAERAGRGPGAGEAGSLSPSAGALGGVVCGARGLVGPLTVRTPEKSPDSIPKLSGGESVNRSCAGRRRGEGEG
jgi:hypothetical protein